MQRVCQRTIGVALAVMIAAFLGCEKKDVEPSRPSGKKPAATSSDGGKPTDVKKAVHPPKEQKPIEKTSLNDALAEVDSKAAEVVPEVKLTEGMRASCLVGVGDAMPQADLQDLDGKTTTLASLLSKSATVVFFWDDGETPTARILAVTALEDIQRDIAMPFADKGLAVIAINVGDTPDDIGKAMTEAGAKFPTLVDQKGEYFAKVVKDGKVPRVYLLDASGKIVWFDVEFSRSTRRDLKLAVPAVLKKK